MKLLVLLLLLGAISLSFPFRIAPKSKKALNEERVAQILTLRSHARTAKMAHQRSAHNLLRNKRQSDPRDFHSLDEFENLNAHFHNPAPFLHHHSFHHGQEFEDFEPVKKKVVVEVVNGLEHHHHAGGLNEGVVVEDLEEPFFRDSVNREGNLDVLPTADPSERAWEQGRLGQESALDPRIQHEVQTTPEGDMRMNQRKDRILIRKEGTVKAFPVKVHNKDGFGKLRQGETVGSADGQVNPSFVALRSRLQEFHELVENGYKDETPTFLQGGFGSQDGPDPRIDFVPNLQEFKSAQGELFQGSEGRETENDGRFEQNLYRDPPSQQRSEFDPHLHEFWDTQGRNFEDQQHNPESFEERFQDQFRAAESNREADPHHYLHDLHDHIHATVHDVKDHVHHKVHEIKDHLHSLHHGHPYIVQPEVEFHHQVGHHVNDFPINTQQSHTIIQNQNFVGLPETPVVNPNQGMQGSSGFDVPTQVGPQLGTNEKYSQNPAQLSMPQMFQEPSFDLTSNSQLVPFNEPKIPSGANREANPNVNLQKLHHVASHVVEPTAVLHHQVNHHFNHFPNNGHQSHSFIQNQNFVGAPNFQQEGFIPDSNFDQARDTQQSFVPHEELFLNIDQKHRFVPNQQGTSKQPSETSTQKQTQTMPRSSELDSESLASPQIIDGATSNFETQATSLQIQTDMHKQQLQNQAASNRQQTNAANQGQRSSELEESIAYNEDSDQLSSPQIRFEQQNCCGFGSGVQPAKVDQPKQPTKPTSQKQNQTIHRSSELDDESLASPQFSGVTDGPPDLSWQNTALQIQTDQHKQQLQNQAASNRQQTNATKQGQRSSELEESIAYNENSDQLSSPQIKFEQQNCCGFGSGVQPLEVDQPKQPAKSTSQKQNQTMHRSTELDDESLASPQFSGVTDGPPDLSWQNTALQIQTDQHKQQLQNQAASNRQQTNATKQGQRSSKLEESIAYNENSDQLSSPQIRFEQQNCCGFGSGVQPAEVDQPKQPTTPTSQNENQTIHRSSELDDESLASPQFSGVTDGPPDLSWQNTALQIQTDMHKQQLQNQAASNRQQTNATKQGQRSSELEESIANNENSDQLSSPQIKFEQQNCCGFGSGVQPVEVDQPKQPAKSTSQKQNQTMHRSTELDDESLASPQFSGVTDGPPDLSWQNTALQIQTDMHKQQLQNQTSSNRQQPNATDQGQRSSEVEESIAYNENSDQLSSPQVKFEQQNCCGFGNGAQPAEVDQPKQPAKPTSQKQNQTIHRSSGMDDESLASSQLSGMTSFADGSPDANLQTTSLQIKTDMHKGRVQNQEEINKQPPKTVIQHDRSLEFEDSITANKGLDQLSRHTNHQGAAKEDILKGEGFAPTVAQPHLFNIPQTENYNLYETREPIRYKRDLSSSKNKIPLMRYFSDPNVHLDIPKTLENFGAATKHALEDERAPMYHLKNLVGSSKDVVLSAMKIPPQHMIFPSDYEIVRASGNEDSAEGLVGESEDPSGFGRTFKKVGHVLRESIKSGQDTASHISDIARNAKNILNTSKHAAPRIISPASQIPALRATQFPKKAVLITPRILDLTEETLGEKTPSSRSSGNSDNAKTIKIGHLMDAMGFSNPNSETPGLERIVFEPRFNRPPKVSEKMIDLYSRFTKDNAEVVGDAIDTLENAKISVGAKNLRDFIARMKSELNKSFVVKKPLKKVPRFQSKRKQKEAEIDKFVETLFDDARVVPRDEDVGLSLPRELWQPFMGRTAFEGVEQRRKAAESRRGMKEETKLGAFLKGRFGETGAEMSQEQRAAEEPLASNLEDDPSRAVYLEENLWPSEQHLQSRFLDTVPEEPQQSLDTLMVPPNPEGKLDQFSNLEPLGMSGPKALNVTPEVNSNKAIQTATIQGITPQRRIDDHHQSQGITSKGGKASGPRHPTVTPVLNRKNYMEPTQTRETPRNAEPFRTIEASQPSGPSEGTSASPPTNDENLKTFLEFLRSNDGDASADLQDKKLGDILGSINSLMFERMYNETMKVNESEANPSVTFQGPLQDSQRVGEDEENVGFSMTMTQPMLKPFMGQMSDDSIKEFLEGYNPGMAELERESSELPLPPALITEEELMNNN